MDRSILCRSGGMVDALVSKTSGVIPVPVRVRPSVPAHDSLPSLFPGHISYSGAGPRRYIRNNPTTGRNIPIMNHNCMFLFFLAAIAPVQEPRTTMSRRAAKARYTQPLSQLFQPVLARTGIRLMTAAFNMAPPTISDRGPLKALQ